MSFQFVISSKDKYLSIYLKKKLGRYEIMKIKLTSNSVILISKIDLRLTLAHSRRIFTTILSFTGMTVFVIAHTIVNINIIRNM